MFSPSYVLFDPQDSDGDKSEDNLVVDVSNEVSCISRLFDSLTSSSLQVPAINILYWERDYTMNEKRAAHRIIT